MNQTPKPLNSSTSQEMDKSIKYNLVEDVTIKHQSTLADQDIPMTMAHILKSDSPELDPGKTLGQLLGEGSLAAPQSTPTSTSVAKPKFNPEVTRINESWRTSRPTGTGLDTPGDKWGDQLLLTFNSVSSGGGGGGGSVMQGKQSFIVLIS